MHQSGRVWLKTLNPKKAMQTQVTQQVMIVRVYCEKN